MSAHQQPTAAPDGPGLSTRDARGVRAKRLDRVDQLAAWFIRLGGLTIVLSVIAIIVFIGGVALPLVRGARTEGPVVRPGAEVSALALWSDEYLQQVAVMQNDGRVALYGLDSLRPEVEYAQLADSVSCAAVSAQQSTLALGHAQGEVRVLSWNWQVEYAAGRRVRASWDDLVATRLFDSGVARIEVARNDAGRIVVLASSTQGELSLYTYDPEWERESTSPIVAPSEGHVSCLALSPDARLAVAGFADGRALVVDCSQPEEPAILQVSSFSDTALTEAAFLLGGQSLVTGDAAGRLTRWLSVLDPGERGRTFRSIDAFLPHESAVMGIVPSPRGKSFVTWDLDGAWSLHHATTSRTQLRLKPEVHASVLAISPKADAVQAALASGGVATWSLENPHPEVTLRTLLGKVWYEGYSSPEWVWQSTGGTDEFEPKLSLVPLLFGTLKGTLYAMLFSVPVAILAAIYVSQLARPRFRAVVKPAIELMAALPSVVVGFLAALWLAPLIEQHLIAAVLLLLAMPLFAVMTAPFWQLLPPTWRERLPEGWELLVALPFIALGVTLALWSAPWVEAAWFAGDVRQWLFVEHGVRFDPRNNIVVGVALGVAVIPIIFTMSEDALSNVPPALVSGALALGASRWQATWRIVLRAASPGIFAAVMLGFGRAVGETMIVLMATGNTPILDWSIFNGMRTMSAAIAVEIPEAPHGGTLYRVLFLTAFLLFLFTLAVNTVATVVSTRLRKRYGRF